MSGKTRHLHFLNAVYGWSELTQSHYHLSLRAESEELGKVLMQVFERYLKQYLPDIQVRFIGGDQQGNFEEVMCWLNQGEIGLHCLTLETQTAPHQEVAL